LDIEASEDLPDVSVMVTIQTLHGTKILTSWTRDKGYPLAFTKGRHGLECRFRNVGLRPGHTVLLNLWMSTENGCLLDVIDNAAVYEVGGDERAAHIQSNNDLGIIVCPDEWRPVAVPAGE
jgi:hypothetical protein